MVNPVLPTGGKVPDIMYRPHRHMGQFLRPGVAFTTSEIDATVALSGIFASGAAGVVGIQSAVMDSDLNAWFGSRLVGIYTVRGGITQASGKVSSWAPIYGSGPAIVQATGSKQPTISGSGSTLVITTNGTSTGLISATSALLNTTINGGLTVWVVASCTPAIPAYTLCVSNATGDKGIGAGTVLTGGISGSACAETQDGSTNAIGPVGSLQIQRTASGRMYLWGAWCDSTNNLLGSQFPPTPAATGGQTTFTNESRAISIGVDASGSFFSAVSIKALVVAQNSPQTGDSAVMENWAGFNEYAQNDPANLLLFDGDSITYGYGLTNFSLCFECLTLQNSAFSAFSSYNMGVPSRTLATMVTQYASTVALRYRASRITNRLTCNGGVNDLVGGASLTTLQNTATAYYTAVIATGFVATPQTIIPCGLVTGAAETIRLNYNSWVVGGGLTGLGCHTPIDVTVNSVFAPGAYTNTTYYQSDQTHPTAAGHAIMAPYFIAGLQL